MIMRSHEKNASMYIDPLMGKAFEKKIKEGRTERRLIVHLLNNVMKITGGVQMSAPNK